MSFSHLSLESRGPRPEFVGCLVRIVGSLAFSSAQSCKIFKTLELLDEGGELSAQNLELLVLTRKILVSKNLAASANARGCLSTMTSS